jgi:hypothetical protein
MSIPMMIYNGSLVFANVIHDAILAFEAQIQHQSNHVMSLKKK